MEEITLFFGTNRKHEGANRWQPDSYGKLASSDGHENLRFGQTTVRYDKGRVTELINQRAQKRKGDGVALSEYLTKRSEDHSSIQAYLDHTYESGDDKEIPMEQNSSYHFFQDLKAEMLKKKDVLIYIHGFNVSWDEAVGGALALQFMLNANRVRGGKEVVVVLFSWPSNGHMIRNAAYMSDRSDARKSGNAIGRALLKLKDFMESLEPGSNDPLKKMCHQKIHLLCHSMGNYVLEHGFKNKLIGYSNGSTLSNYFDHIFLCAPDVNDDSLESPNGLSRLHEIAKYVTVYFNDGDMAMHIGKYTKTFTERLGHTGNARPSNVHNKVNQVDCSPIVHGIVEHSYYLWATVNQDIAQSLGGWRMDHESRNRKNLGQNREWRMV